MKLTDAVSLGQPDSRPLAREGDADGARVVPENRKSLRCTTTGSDATTHVPPPTNTRATVRWKHRSLSRGKLRTERHLNYSASTRALRSARLWMSSPARIRWAEEEWPDCCDECICLGAAYEST